MTNLPKELQEIRANVDVLVQKYKKIKADMPVSPDSCGDDTHDQMMRDMQDTMYQMLSYVHQRISNAEDTFYNYTSDHQLGHLPSIKGAEKMQTALKVLKLDGDYEVYKPMIAAASEKYGFDIKDLKVI